MIESGNIASISIGNNKETPDKGGVAIAQLPEKIMEAQSYDVDAVTGATVTSNGIKDAVARCLEKASGYGYGLVSVSLANSHLINSSNIG